MSQAPAQGVVEGLAAAAMANWGIPIPGPSHGLPTLNLTSDPRLTYGTPFVFPPPLPYPPPYPQAIPYTFTPPIPMNPIIPIHHRPSTPQSHRSRKEKLICRSIVAADGVSSDPGAEFPTRLPSGLEGLEQDGIDIKPVLKSLKTIAPRTPGPSKPGVRRGRPAGSDTSPRPPPRKLIRTLAPFPLNRPLLPSFPSPLSLPSTSNNHTILPRIPVPSNHPPYNNSQNSRSLLLPKYQPTANPPPTTNGNGFVIDPILQRSLTMVKPIVKPIVKPRVFKHPRVKKEKPDKASKPRIKKEKLDKVQKVKKPRIPKVPKTPRIPKGQRVPKIPKDSRVPRIPKDSRVPRIPKDGRVPRIPKEGRVPRIPKEGRVPRIPKEGRVPRIPKNPRVPRIPKEKKEKIPKTPKTPKQPRTPGITKTPRRPKDPNATPRVPRKPKVRKSPKPPRITKKKQKMLHDYFIRYTAQYERMNGPLSPDHLEMLRERIINPTPSEPPSPKRKQGNLQNENLEHDVRDESDDSDSGPVVNPISMPRPAARTNTHLLLSPINLKRMLKTAPSTAASSYNEDEQDEELMNTSNSLFRDLSLNRQFKTPSPTGDSQFSGSPSSRTSLVSVSPTTGRQRYSRRKFGRLFPSFETNHCASSEDVCMERPLTGSYYCGMHMEPDSSPLHSQCSYTCPSSLKRCEEFTVGDDEREIRFCDAHATRIAATRQKQLRYIPPLPKTMEDLKMELQRNIELTDDDDEEDKVPETDANGDFKEELSPEFNVELPVSLLQRGKNLGQMSEFQMDADPDEDVLDADDTNLLQNAGYFSTDEVVSIYRAKLEKLRSMYIGQLGVLKNYYMEYSERFENDMRRNQTRKVSFTSNPRLLRKGHFKVKSEFYDRQMAENERLNSLLRYHHEKGRAAVIEEIAKEEYDDVMAKEAAQKKLNKAPKADDTEDEEVEIEYESDGDDEEKSPYDYFFKMEEEEDAKEAANPTPETPNADAASNSPEVPPVEVEVVVEAEPEIPEVEVCSFENPEKNPSRCTEPAIPCSKYCQDHIMHDMKQNLFSLCNRIGENDEAKCQAPILTMIDKLGCPLHRWPQVKSYKELKTERKKRLQTQATYSKATAEEEEEILQNLVVQEAVSLEEFDEAIKYIMDKGFDAPDTDDSSEDDSEEEDDGPRLSPPSTTPVSDEPCSSTSSTPTLKRE